MSFIADTGDARQRLDLVLVRRLRGVSNVTRTQAQRWIRDGRVRVSGELRTRPSDGVAAGARVEVDLPEGARRTRPDAEAIALDILYEDEWLIAINKPAGMVVHPTYKHATGTLLGGVLWHLRGRPHTAPGIVSRLDKDTSGVLLVALTPVVHARIQRDAAAGRVRKEYLAVVRGTPRPPRGTITLPLARDPDDRRRVVATATGQRSETRYEVVSARGSMALVRCELVTGRTHQIRVHLSASGWPIVGDRVYGEADAQMARQALHAHRLRFTHPVSGAAMDIAAPLPGDVEELLAAETQRRKAQK